MIQWIKKYRAFTFEQRTIFNTRFSIVFNVLMAIGKISLTYFHFAFLVSGIVNIFIMLAKLECFLGETKPEKKSFRYRNNLIGLFLMLAGIQYSIYMCRLIFTNVEVRQYTLAMGVIIAFVSFIEMGVAIKGCFNAYGRGHYYRNLKIISLCSAFTAIALTELAIMSFASSTPSREIDGIFGVCVGMIIFILGAYILVAPKLSILDRRHHLYYLTEDTDITEDEFVLQLTHSKVYGNYVFVATIKSGIVEGWIFKLKSPIRHWNIVMKILIIILSEILIFPYAIGGLIFYFRTANLVNTLNKKMAERGCMHMDEQRIEHFE